MTALSPSARHSCSPCPPDILRATFVLAMPPAWLRATFVLGCPPDILRANVPNVRSDGHSCGQRCAAKSQESHASSGRTRACVCARLATIMMRKSRWRGCHSKVAVGQRNLESGMGGKRTLAKRDPCGEQTHRALFLTCARATDFEKGGPVLSYRQDNASITALRVISLVDDKTVCVGFYPIKIEVLHWALAADNLCPLGQAKALAANRWLYC